MLSGSLGEKSLRRNTFFMPAYPLSEQCLEVANTKIFPKAIERMTQPGGALDSFHVVDLLQMCCLSGKSGALQLIAGVETGFVFLRNGELRHAEISRSRGLQAIYEMLRGYFSKFTYDANASPAEQTIDIGWDAAMIEVVLREREEQALQPGPAPELEVSTSRSRKRWHISTITRSCTRRSGSRASSLRLTRGQTGRRRGGEPGDGAVVAGANGDPDGRSHAHPDDESDRHSRQRPRS
jgi:Domain of unknown function (DUF4388)